MRKRQRKKENHRVRVSRIIEGVLVIAMAFVKYYGELNRSCISAGADPAILFVLCFARLRHQQCEETSNYLFLKIDAVII